MNANVQAEYQKKIVSVEAAAASIQDNDRILVATSSSQPRALLRKLSERTYDLKNVQMVGSFFADDYEFLKNEAHGHINTLISFMVVKSRE